jgi:adenylate cyclase
MPDVFISYARSTARQARQVADLLRAQALSVWIDDELPAHRAYSEVIEEQLRSASAVVVVWSAEATKSQWVRAEADVARQAGTLVQLTVDGAALPLPFNQIQCAELSGWSGDPAAAGWRKVASSIAALIGRADLAESPGEPAPPPLPNKPSIAVMPFANLSGDPEQAYFADGMVEEIVAALSRFKSIFVIGAGSTFSFRDATAGPLEAARRLGVRYVLEGSVRKSGERVRIAVKLTDASGGTQIWADRFEDTLEDVFALQDKVALTVAGVIEPAVSVLEMRRASRRPTENMGSHDLYLRASSLKRTYAKPEMSEALELLNRSLALDPDYGAALALAASCHVFLYVYGWSDDPETDHRLAVERVHRALKVAGDDAEVVARAAFVAENLEDDYAASIQLADRAIGLNPGSPFVWSSSAGVRLRAGELDRAIEHAETSLRLDPVGPDRSEKLFLVGIARFQQGRFGEAAPLLKEHAQQTGSPLALTLLAAAYGHLGQPREALEVLKRRTSRPGTGFGPRPGHEDLRRLAKEGLALAKAQAPDR